MQQNNAKAKHIEKVFSELRYGNKNATKKIEDWINTPRPRVPASVDEFRKSIGRPIYKSLPQTAEGSQILSLPLYKNRLKNDIQGLWLAVAIVGVWLIAVPFFLGIVGVIWLLLDLF
jgi:hypothetical protein